MQRFNRYSLLALLGGSLLALMIHLNSQLASATSALSASWLAHGIGGCFALCLLTAIKSGSRPREKPMKKLAPIYYLGGIPGALTIILASITINSGVGLSGTLALALIGQLVFSILSEYFGLFNLRKRKVLYIEWLPIVLVVLGAFILIFSKG